MVKGKQIESSGGAKSGAKGSRSDQLTQCDRRRNGPRQRGFTQLSYYELMERKQKGLCFKCGGSFPFMHQCPEKQLRVLVVDGDKDGEEDVKILAVEVEDVDDEGNGEFGVLNLHHIAHETPHTVKF